VSGRSVIRTGPDSDDPPAEVEVGEPRLPRPIVDPSDAKQEAAPVTGSGEPRALRFGRDHGCGSVSPQASR
jgi:hypothetical protein